jgi:adenylate cyclase
MFGELLPLGGGDPIPLLKRVLLVGRRESADIVLRFPNVSGSHCELSLVDGYWHVKDLRSSNGVKVNGSRVTQERLKPGDRLSIGKHEYEIAYEPARLGASATNDDAAGSTKAFARSLLEAAGLEHRRSAPQPKPRRPAT